MLQLIVDGVAIWSSNQQTRHLLALRTTEGLNKSGTLELTMPQGHPAYNSFTSFRSVVELYEDDALRFRGRALYSTDDFFNRRTVMCEGERGFLRDGVIRPYLYQDSPAAIFADALAKYNAEADPFKRFSLGTVTVTDANDYVRMESTNASSFLEFFDKLVERCGGYITFNSDGQGGRAINWLTEIGRQSDQAIQFGENLLDFTRSGQSDDLATAVLPYGAQDEEGNRVTIQSVTPDGSDWIQDDDAVAVRGLILATVTWDDVTQPQNLLTKAQRWLAQHRLAVTSLELSAADLSRLDSSIDSYHVGDRVHVVSAPHGVDDWFILANRSIDWLDPAGGSISLGKQSASLTGADVTGDRNSTDALAQTRNEITADYKAGIAAAVQETTLALSSLIQQTSESIMLQVSQSYATGEDVRSLVSTQITQLADSVELTFQTLRTQVETLDGDTVTRFTEISKYIRFEDGNIVLGEAGNDLTLRIQNDRISFLDGGAEVAYFSNKQLFVTDAHFLNSLRVGRFAWVPRENGNLSLIKVGD